MVHEYVREVSQLVDALQAAHAGVANLAYAAAELAGRARAVAAG